MHYSGFTSEIGSRERGERRAEIDDSVDVCGRSQLINALTGSLRTLLLEGDAEAAKITIVALQQLAALFERNNVSDFEAARARLQKRTE